MNEPPDYATYMRSSAWQARRAWYAANRPWRCAVCDSGRRLDLHHLTYDRLGRERLDDLVPLCRRHHREAHALVQRGVPLAIAHKRLVHDVRGTVVRLASTVGPAQRRKRQCELAIRARQHVARNLDSWEREAQGPDQRQVGQQVVGGPDQ